MSSPVSRSPKPVVSATFTLFKSTSPANRDGYVGHVITPDGTLYAIAANVSEHDRPDGTKGKHFEGLCYGGQRIVREMLRGAKVDGELPPDLVALMEGTPYDDSLERV